MAKYERMTKRDTDGQAMMDCETCKWNAMLSMLTSIGGGYERLRQLAEADKDGRLVVLPCEIGTATYYIHYPIAFYPDESEPEIKRGIFTLCDLDRFGHSVFLTREEAEKALEEKKDD